MNKTLKMWRIKLARKLLGENSEVEGQNPDLSQKKEFDLRASTQPPTQDFDLPACAFSGTDRQQSGEPSKTILIIDDDAIILKTTSWKLEAAGYGVAVATDGPGAIGAINEEKPDLVLLDLDFPPDVAHGGMPAWDGFRLMFWLRSMSNIDASKFIIITSSDSDEFEKRALAAGAVGFFRKPLDYDKLLAVIENELNKGSAQPPHTASFSI
jgi:two-component system sensor histidine kinase/response regulator